MSSAPEMREMQCWCCQSARWPMQNSGERALQTSLWSLIARHVS